MNMSVLERLITLSILPKEGDFATLRVLQSLKMALSFTEDELNTFGITSDPETQQTHWEVDEDTEIPIGEKATDIIVEALKKLDSQKKLPEEAMGVYEKFIPTTE